MQDMPHESTSKHAHNTHSLASMWEEKKYTSANQFQTIYYPCGYFIQNHSSRVIEKNMIDCTCTNE